MSVLRDDDPDDEDAASEHNVLLGRLGIRDSSGPLGFFWDLENCQVAASKSALNVVQSLRNKFNNVGREMEFIVVCDVTKEACSVIDDFNAAQVTVIHVSSVSKNAADEKLKSCLRKFSHTHTSPGVVVLISGDVNFAPELSDLRYRFGFSVVILHGPHVNEALLATANAHYSFHQFLEDVPQKSHSLIGKPKAMQLCTISVSNLPCHVPSERIRERLRRLCDNCGGRVLNVDTNNGMGIIQFPNATTTQRSLKRLNGEDVFGHRINVALTSMVRSNFDSSLPLSQLFTPLLASGLQSGSSSSLDSESQTAANAFRNSDGENRCGKCRVVTCRCEIIEATIPVNAAAAAHQHIRQRHAVTPERSRYHPNNAANRARNRSGGRSVARRLSEQKPNMNQLFHDSTNVADDAPNSSMSPIASSVGFSGFSNKHNRWRQDQEPIASGTQPAPNQEQEQDQDSDQVELCEGWQKVVPPPRYMQGAGVDAFMNGLGRGHAQQIPSGINPTNVNSPGTSNSANPNHNNKFDFRAHLFQLNRNNVDGGNVRPEMARSEPYVVRDTDPATVSNCVAVSTSNACLQQALPPSSPLHGTRLRVDNIDSTLTKSEIESGIVAIFGACSSSYYTQSVKVCNVDVKLDTDTYLLYAVADVVGANAHLLHNMVRMCSGEMLGQQRIVVSVLGQPNQHNTYQTGQAAPNAIETTSTSAVNASFHQQRLSSQQRQSQPNFVSHQQRQQQHVTLPLQQHYLQQSNVQASQIVDVDDQDTLLIDAMKQCAVKILKDWGLQPMPLSELLDGLRFALKQLSLLSSDSDPINPSDLTCLSEVVQIQDNNGRMYCSLIADPYAMGGTSNVEQAEDNDADDSSSSVPPSSGEAAASTRHGHAVTASASEAQQHNTIAQFADKLYALLVVQSTLTLPVNRFNKLFEDYYGTPFTLADYNVRSFTQLVKMCEPSITMLKTKMPQRKGSANTRNGNDTVLLLMLSDREQRIVRTAQICYLFLRKPDLELNVNHFSDRFSEHFNVSCDAAQLCGVFSDIIQVRTESGTSYVRLTPTVKFALRGRILLLACAGCQMNLSDFEQMYERRYKQSLASVVASSSSSHLNAMIKSISFILFLKGRSPATRICINPKFLACLKPQKPDVIVPSFGSVNQPLIARSDLSASDPRWHNNRYRRTLSTGAYPDGEDDRGGFATATDLAARDRSSDTPHGNRSSPSRHNPAAASNRGSKQQTNAPFNRKAIKPTMVEREVMNWTDSKFVQLDQQREIWNGMNEAVLNSDMPNNAFANDAQATSTPKESHSDTSSYSANTPVLVTYPLVVNPLVNTPKKSPLSTGSKDVEDLSDSEIQEEPVASKSSTYLVRPADLLAGGAIREAALNMSVASTSQVPRSTVSCPVSRTQSRLAARFDNLKY